MLALDSHLSSANAQLGSALLMLRIAYYSDQPANRTVALEAFWYEIGLYYDKIAQYPFTCASGCYACCFDNPHGVSELELRRVFEQLSAQQKEAIVHQAQRYRTLPVMEESQRQLIWKALREPCPLLSQGRCTVYEHRPLACRSFFSVESSSRCDPAHKDYTAGIQVVGTEELHQLLGAFSEGSDIKLPTNLLCGLAALVEEE